MQIRGIFKPYLYFSISDTLPPLVDGARVSELKTNLTPPVSVLCQHPVGWHDPTATSFLSVAAWSSKNLSPMEAKADRGCANDESSPAFLLILAAS